MKKWKLRRRCIICKDVFYSTHSSRLKCDKCRGIDNGTTIYSKKGEIETLRVGNPIVSD